MLDIGEGTGALVVYTSEILAGQEIEIRPHGGDWDGTHTDVRARHMGDRVLHAGVFGSLVAGPYDVRVRPAARGHVHDGHPHHGYPADGHHSHGPASASAGIDAKGQTVMVPSGAVSEITLVDSSSAPPA